MSRFFIPEKNVTFHKRVKVFYYKSTPVESCVDWQQVARDRERFNRRILEFEGSIAWIFNKQHREHVYKTLYLAPSVK